MSIKAAQGVDPRQRIVVGHGDDPEARGGVSRDDFCGWEFAVAEDRVQVQVRPAVGYLCQWWPILGGRSCYNRGRPLHEL